MKEQVSDLNQFLMKYKAEIENLEKQVKEKKEKLKVIYEALDLLQQEGVTNLSMPSKTESISEKYKGLSLNKAILSILSDSNGYLSGHEIYSDLIKNGFESGSGDIKRDVHINLYRLEKDHKVIAKKQDNRKIYMLKHPEKDL